MRKFLFLLILILLLIFFLPWILSSPFGKFLVEKEFSKKSGFTVSITKVSWSWLGPQAFEGVAFQNEAITGTVNEVKLTLPLWKIEEWRKEILIKGGTLFFSKENLHFTEIEGTVAENNIDLSGKGSHGGNLLIRGTIASQSNFDVELHLKDFPSIAIDELLHAEGLFSTFLSPLFNCDAHLSPTSIAGTLNSKTANVALDGSLHEGFFFLSRPFTLSLMITPEIAKELQKRFALDLLQAQNPFRLQIDPAGAKIPISPFSLKNLQIGHGTLDLGKFIMDKALSFPPLFSLPSPLSVWLTQIFFSINQETIQLDRVDGLLGGKVHLCSWGQIQLLTSALHLTLGFPADTLEKLLKVSSLPPTYVLQIPVTGTLQDPQLATSIAASKMGALVAIQHGEQAGGLFGKKGRMIGKVIQQATPFPQDPPAPPPHLPFPWE
ncbi:MAG TPA: hypothetical protein VJK48_06810 [Chlamydiales bacterium]|nr:hypothetical protein [Chlamydiales bacterium]